MPEDGSLQAFIRQHAHPYDAETDTYDRPPFAIDIKEGKNEPIYSAHSYHTKVPPRGIVPFILHYTEPGDLILDSFCGSGMTGVAALLCADPPGDLLEQLPELKDRVGRRYTILNDLSPAACHIAYNYTTPVDVEALRVEFERITAAVKDEMDLLYNTEHYEPAVGDYDPRRPEVAELLRNPPLEGRGRVLLPSERAKTWELIDRAEVERRLGYPVTELPASKRLGIPDVECPDRWIAIPATIQYTVWSDVYRCEGFVTVEEPTGKMSTRGRNAGKPMVSKKRVKRGCGASLVLWDLAVDRNAQTVSEAFSCPSCPQVWTKLSLQLSGTVPVHISYSFSGLAGRSKRLERPIGFRDRMLLDDIRGRGLSPFFPDVEIDPGRELMTMGPGKRGMRSLADFYTPRNQRALGHFWNEIDHSPVALRSHLLFLFTAILDVASRRNRWPQQAVMSSTLYVPSIQIEMNVLSQMERRLERFLKAYAASAHASNEVTPAVQIRVGDARCLSEIPDECCDFAFIDPPFGGNIYYADANLLADAWLGVFTPEPADLVYNRQRRQDKDFRSLSDYAEGMEAAFVELFRVLKPGRWVTLEFNNSEGEVFDVIRNGVTRAGFIIENMLLLDKDQKSFKQVKGIRGDEDVVNTDVIFNLRKPVKAEISGKTVDTDLERMIVEVVREHLRTLPQKIRTEPGKYTTEHRTTATLNSVLINALLPKGVSVERLNLPLIERVCGRYFRKVGQRWYLRGEAVGDTLDDTLFEEEITVSDEQSAIRWLRQRLHAAPTLIGELRPHWMRATGLLPQDVSELLVLEDLLSENFWRDDDTNRWREPTEDERERMNDDRALRVFHDAERFLKGTLMKHHPSDAERAEWVDVLYRAVAEGKGQAGPAFRRFDPGEAWAVVARLASGLLPENLEVAVRKRVRKQGDVATRKLRELAPKADEAGSTQKDGNLPLFVGLDEDNG